MRTRTGEGAKRERSVVELNASRSPTSGDGTIGGGLAVDQAR
jgi:hypothetical protein